MAAALCLEMEISFQKSLFKDGTTHIGSNIEDFTRKNAHFKHLRAAALEAIILLSFLSLLNWFLLQVLYNTTKSCA